MSRDIINAVQAPYRHSWSLLTQFMDACPENIWNETNGGWPVWQQVAHTIAVLDFFTLGAEDALLPAPCDQATLFLKMQGAGAVGKDAMREYAEAVRIRVDAWLEGLSDADLVRVHDVLSKKIGRDVTYGAAVAMLASHSCYHIGSCDAALRNHGLPGVF